MKSWYRGWGTKVQNRRKALGISSQERLAQITGLHQTTISKIESGSMCPSDQAKWLIAGALRCRLDDLFPWPIDEPPIPQVDCEIRGAA